MLVVQACPICLTQPFILLRARTGAEIQGNDDEGVQLPQAGHIQETQGCYDADSVALSVWCAAFQKARSTGPFLWLCIVASLAPVWRQLRWLP